MNIRKMKNNKQKALAAVLALGLTIGVSFTPMASKAEAGFFDPIGVLTGILNTGIEANARKTALLVAGNNPVIQQQLLEKAGSDSVGRDGRPISRPVDPQAVAVTDDIMNQMVEKGYYALRNESLPFRWKTIADNTFNASCDFTDFITVHDTAVKACGYNRDMVAALLGHEMAHGYNQHIARSVQKKVWTSYLGNLALDGLALTNFPVGSTLPENQINFAKVKNINISDENHADRSGFYTMASAGFNPGGAAALMARMSYYTDHRDQLQDFFQPTDHPDTRKRLERMAKLLTDYSIGHATVQNVNDVYFDKTRLLIAEPSGAQDAEEMTYLIAGGIAKGMHDNKSVTGWNFRKDASGHVDFLTDDPAYAPLKAALKLEDGLGATFQSLVEAAYTHDAATGSRAKFLADEMEHNQQVVKTIADEAANKDDAPDKVANGAAYLKLGLTDYDEKEYRRASKLDAANPSAKSGLAVVHSRRGDYDGAMRLVNEAIAMNPSLGASYVDRALIYKDMGKLDEALADCNHALSVGKADYAYKIAGDIFDQKGAPDAALQEYAAYLNHEPNAKDIPSEYMMKLN